MKKNLDKNKQLIKKLVCRYTESVESVSNSSPKKEKDLEENGTTTSNVASVSSPFAFSSRGVGNTRAALSSLKGWKSAKPANEGSDSLETENQKYSEPAYVSPAQNIEPVDKYEDEQGLIQKGNVFLDDLDGDPLISKDQSALPMYEVKISNWYEKLKTIAEGLSGLKYSLKTEADSVQPPQVSTPVGKPVDVQNSPGEKTPQTFTSYDVKGDFTNFDLQLKNSTEQLKTNLQKTIQNKILNKKIIIRASKGVGLESREYTVNATGVGIDYFYDKYIIVVIGREEGKRKTSRFLLDSGYSGGSTIKIIGPADLTTKDKEQINRSKAVVSSDGSVGKGGSGDITQKEPPPKEKSTVSTSSMNVDKPSPDDSGGKSSLNTSAKGT